MTDRLTILQGDCLVELGKLPSESVHCCVTSPPYWGLRDYGVAGQIGLEKTPEDYVAKMVVVFREIHRVLREDGTLWLNSGDSYFGAGQRGSQFGSEAPQPKWADKANKETCKRGEADPRHWLKFKDLCGIPWMLARALQRPFMTCGICGIESHLDLWLSIPSQFVDFSQNVKLCPRCGGCCDPKVTTPGWYLRSDIIWHKPNPMPESVTDRPTKSHEYLFLLAKSERYYFDAEAIKEKLETEPHAPGNKMHPDKISGPNDRNGHSQWETSMDKVWGASGTRNKRSVWTVTSAPYRGAHFATFPPDLIKPCILAGTSAKGCCPKCGAGWERVLEKVKGTPESFNGSDFRNGKKALSASALAAVGQQERTAETKTVGWQPTCTCNAKEAITHNDTIPCTVLDPFGGSGTTGEVALELGRNAILIELNPKYVRLIESRTNITPGLALA